jgi:hypothetical protein
MRQRIRFAEKGRYARIVARIPADLERACSRLSKSQGWELGDLYRSLILLGACGSYLTLRPPKPSQRTPDDRFSGVLERYLGGRAYTPRTGRRSKIMTAYLPIGVARSLALYSKLTTKLPSHVYTRFLRAGLLIYVRCEQRLAEALGASGPRVSADTNDDRR